MKIAAINYKLYFNNHTKLGKYIMCSEFIEAILIPISQICIYIFGFSSIYLLIKYRTLVFWEKATKKELMFPVVGFFGGLIFGILAVIIAVIID